MDNVMISVNFMKIGWFVAVPLIIIGILTYVLNNKFIECIFAIIKACCYGILGLYMWKYVEKLALNEVGIITVFTGIFCYIECGDNLVKVIGMIIQAIRYLILTYKKE